MGGAAQGEGEGATTQCSESFRALERGWSAEGWLAGVRLLVPHLCLVNGAM